MARNLLEAEQTRQAIPALTEAISDLTIDEAYRIQLMVISSKHSAANLVVGKKIGLTSLAMQRLLGCSNPITATFSAAWRWPQAA